MTVSSPFVHIVMTTDSLSFPRPWNAKKAAEAPEQFFRFRETYPYLLLKRLREALPDQECVVSNLGQRASTIAGASLKRADLLSYMEPTASIVHHGIVDCWVRENEPERFRVDKTKFAEHLELIVENKERLAPKLPLIFIGVMPTIAAMLERVPDQNDVIAEYNEVFRRVLKDRAIFMDVEGLFSHKVEDVVHLDGHHLSRTGHRLYADELFRILMMNGVGE